MQEGVDFYYEGNLVVFTAEFHLKRGYCCRSKCRHCPWRKQKKKAEETSDS